MKISFDNFHLFVDTQFFNPNKKTILFIHGFTGSSKDWQNIIPQIDESFSRVAIDLVGHGQSSSPEEISFYKIESITQQLKKVLEKLKIDKVIFAGYSMGGRVALSFTEAYPQLLHSLILESATAGIETETERKTRFESDGTLAKKIINDGIENFVEYWMNLPIFESQKNLPIEKINQIKKNKLSNNPIGLSNSLLGFSTGIMPTLWNNLADLKIPTLLLSGQLDSKYVNINQKMNKLIKFSEFQIVKNAGHNIHLEKPSEFIIFVNRFLREKLS